MIKAFMTIAMMMMMMMTGNLGRFVSQMTLAFSLMTMMTLTM